MRALAVCRISYMRRSVGITVAALSNSKLASDGTTGTDIGKMFAAAFKEIANAET